MKESIPHRTPEMTESQAEEQLEILLSDPSNSFLTKIKANREIIENAETAKAALFFAQGKVKARLESSTTFHQVALIEGLELKEVSHSGLNLMVETVLKNAQEIGRGGDAFVVVDKNEIREFPPEICYKFAIAEKTPRGRNPISEEADLQGRFRELSEARKDLKIGVPIPFYSLEIGDKKLIAMEKLNAKSVEDILRSKGFLPDWLDIDEFCDELESLLNYFHDNHLYHRDMHFGNVMISQKRQLEEGDKMGFVIDFGLSGEAVMDEFAYVKDMAGMTFTYNDDYGIITTVKEALKALKSRQNRGA